MTWWLWLIVALALYLLVSMTPYVLLQIAIWRIRRRLPFLSVEAQQFERQIAVEREHAELWPARPRPGRYEPVDRIALDQMVRLRVIISQVNDLWPGVAGFEPALLSPLQVLAMGAWRPLISSLRAWRDKRRLDALLREGQGAVAVLLAQWTEAQSIPARIQAGLSDLRAEARRLQALWEAEVESGMQGLDALGSGLSLLDHSLGEALDSLRETNSQRLAATALQAETRLAQAIESTSALERELQQAIETRRRARESLDRAQAGLRQAQERWQALQDRGAKDPAVAQRVQELQTRTKQLTAVAQAATPKAYAEALAGAEAYRMLEQSVGEQLSALDDLMRRSHEALAGDVGALTAAQQTCDALREASGLALDLSEARIAQAQEIYAQAEEQDALGAWHGYQMAISLAEQAREALQEASNLAESAGEALVQIQAKSQQATPEIRQALRQRARSVGEALRYYVKHWDGAREAESARILALLDQAEAAWERLPAAILREQQPKQSELPEAVEGLGQITAATRRARQLVEELDGRLTRLNNQRRMLEEGLEELAGALAPALAAAQEGMLTELRDRYGGWQARYEARLPELRDPAQIHYDEAADRWLPDVQAEAREMLAAHGEDLVRYRRQAQESRKRLEREWQRLQKLDPLEPPLTEEDMERLTGDYDAWQTELDAAADSPVALSELVSRRAAGLERRIEAGRRQINEGRQALATLDRQYGQQLQAVQKSRAAMRALLQDSQWQQIEWDLTDGEALVERAATYQDASRRAELLDEAANQMQRAVNTAQEALQVYQGIEQQLRSAQERLNREFRAASADLDRAQRQAGQLRQQGPSEALRALEGRCAEATSLIGMAQRSPTFEDALRHLREAQEKLARS